MLSLFALLAAEPTDSVLVKLVLSLLQLCKLAANHPGGADILGIKSNSFSTATSQFPVLQTQIFPCRGSRQLSGRTGSCGFLHHRPASRQRHPLREGRVSLHLHGVTVSLHHPELHEWRTHSTAVRWQLDQTFVVRDRGGASALCLYLPRSVLWLVASIEVRKAAAQCVTNILAAQSGVDFWEQHKDNRDPMLAYLNPFRKAKKKVGDGGFSVWTYCWKSRSECVFSCMCMYCCPD